MEGNEKKRGTQMKDREKVVIKTSIISIIANLFLSGFKVMVGLLSNSIAILSDAINNLSDAISSIITIVGTKLASKKPNKKHPYGYGRIEYMTSLIVSVIVLYAGITAMIESIKKIIHPESVEYTTITLVILIVGILVKFILGVYVKQTGKKVHSDSLVASGSDAFNDAILSISVLASAILYNLLNWNIEAYMGAILSLFIIKAGLELIKEAVDNILGNRIEKSLSQKIKKEILKEKEVKGVYDLILTDYGPDAYHGSAHIELLDTLSVTEVDNISRRITKHVLESTGVILHTLGVYSVNTKDKEVIKMRETINKIVFNHQGILQVHGFYVNKEDHSMNFDMVMSFDVEDKETLVETIKKEIKEKYPKYDLNIALDIDISD